jgi:hypothetical protein
MSDREKAAGERAPGIRVRSAEIVVALVVFALGTLVVYDSHRLGSSWGSDGPEAGYFPFYIGLFICISSAVVFCESMWGRRLSRDAVFVEWQALRQVLSILLPAAVYVLAIQLIGIYVASAIYIAAFMLWLGNYSWLKSVLLGVAVSAAAFVTFEVWFQVPLYKGAFDALWFLGY